MNLKQQEMVAVIADALEQVEEWKPVYLALLKTCKTRQDAKDALGWLIKHTGGVLK